MKKKILSVLTSLVALISLSSCSLVNKEEDDIEYSYTDLPPEKEIQYSDLFNQEDDFYMVYCFSTGCSACMSFRNYIVPYFLNHLDFPLYYANISLVGEHVFDNLPEDALDTSATIGMTSMDDFFLYATPSLVGFYQNAVIFNLWGSNSIKEALDLFDSLS